MRKLNHKIFILYISLFLLLDITFSLTEDPIDTEPISELYQKVSSSYMKEVISDLSQLAESYVFSDILNSSLNPFSSSRFNITDELGKIKTNEERPFYEFYRDIRKTFANCKDSVLEIIGGEIPFEDSNTKLNFTSYRICLPFQFYLDYEKNEPIKLYIKEYPFCSEFFDEKVKEKIKSFEKVPLKEINDIDAFDYLQNFGNEFYKMKNPDSYFQLLLDTIHSMHLIYFPLLPEQINKMNLLFSNNETFSINYHLVKGPLNANLNTLTNGKSERLNEKGLNDIINNLNMKQEILSDSKQEIKTKNEEIKCIIDNTNLLNVLILNSLEINDSNDFRIIIQCVSYFYSNEYKIVIITNQALNGNTPFSYLFTQLFLPKIKVKYNFAMKNTELNKEIFQLYKNQFLDAKTCVNFESFEELIKSEPDDYGDGIKHSRTKIFNPIPRQLLQMLNELRKRLKTELIDKKSTDILILTDTASFGATSNFIKIVQNNGGAIVAIYGGNPKLNKDQKKELDTSMDACDSITYEKTKLFSSLAQKGFIIEKLPFAETFENIEGDKIPMAFKINKPDEVTDIYHFYDDKYYDEFITTAKNIFEKYKTECNKDNLKLVLESDKCSFEDIHSHGGYKCGSDGKWGKECQPYYCDVGYYFNTLTHKCQKDECFSTEYINLDKEIDHNFTIFPNTTYAFQLSGDLIYFFTSPIDDIIHNYDFEKYPRFCAVNKDKKIIYINLLLNLKETIQINVVSLKMNAYAQTHLTNSPQLANILPMKGDKIEIFELTEDNYLFIDSYDKNSKFYFAEYNENMSINELKNCDEKYFTEASGQIRLLKKNKIYIGIFLQNMAFYKIYFYNSFPENINIINGDKSILYLESNKKYTLDFSHNTIPFIIRLNEKTNATIKIVDTQYEEKIIYLSNKYYYPSAPNEILMVYLVDNQDALIEILYSYINDMDLIKESEFDDYIISKNVTFIEYLPKDNKKNMQIHFESNKEFSFVFYGGITKDFYIHKTSIRNAYFSDKDFYIKIDDPFKDINSTDIEDNEKYYISLIFSKSDPNQEIKISLNYYENIIDTLNIKMSESYINGVTSNLAKLIENFSFINITKNPPDPEGYKGYAHPPIDLVQTLNDLSKTNKKFYDFYGTIRETLCTPRDPHLRIYAKSTPNGVIIKYLTACLPFSFYVDKDKDQKPKLYIKYFEECAVYFDENVRQYIQKKIDNKIPLESINNERPFDYIQKWGIKYVGLKNPNAHFTYVKRVLHAFSLSFFPLDTKDLKMSFKFEDEEEPLNIDYYLFMPNIINTLNKDEFDEYFESKVKKYRNILEEPSIFEIMNNYQKEKGILKQEKPKNIEIQWDFRTDEVNGIRCKYDKDKKINVLVQENFNLEKNKAHEIIYKCAKLFYENPYKIVVIQNLNGGGWGELSLALRQLLQVKIKNRSYMCAIPSQLVKDSFISLPDSYPNIETCQRFKDADDFLSGQDVDYSTEKERIIHKKTKMYDLVSRAKRIDLEEKRKELLKMNIKNPTDIILFLDSYAYSATSIFAKAFQNEGAAITVGFNGNPDLPKYLFDASQSPGPVSPFDATNEAKILNSLGIAIRGITIGESYEDDYVKEKPIPREYKIDPVDERVDIYEPYTDEKYDLFIEKAEEIFKKYNENGQCNVNNTKLVFEKDNNCLKFDDDIHAHGGYACGSDGNWSTTCQKYYCDLGYYYNVYEGKCKRDYCGNPQKELTVSLNDNYENTIILNGENNDEYIFNVDTYNFIYIFKTNEPGYIYYDEYNPCPSLCILQKGASIHKDKVLLNHNKNITNKDIIIKITSIKNFEGSIESVVFKELNYKKIRQISSKLITIITFTNDYIFYLKTFDDSYDSFFTEYNENMNISDIIDINQKYFKKCSNQILEAKKNKLYIFATSTPIAGKLLQIFMQPKILDNKIDITNDVVNSGLYLSKEKEYTLNFEKNTKDIIIQLNKVSIDTEIVIKGQNKEVILNSKNSYYTFDDINGIFKENLKAKINKGDNCLIEFLSKIDDNNYDILEEKEYSEKRLLKPSIIKFDKNSENTFINLTLSSKTGKEFGYWSINGYSKKNYINLPSEQLPEILGKSSYDLRIYKNKETLENDESFYLIIHVNESLLSNDDYNIVLSKKECREDSNPNDKGEEGKEGGEGGLESWAIALIVVGCVIVVAIVILLILKFTVCKKDTDVDGPLVNQEKSNMREMTDNY